MLIRIVKSFVLAVITTIVGYTIAQSNTSQNKSVAKKIENKTKDVSYKRRFNGGILTLKADEVVERTKEHIFLYGIKAKYEKNGKVVSLESNKCIISINGKKALLQQNVMIQSADVSCCTSNALVDFSAHTITGKDKVTGTSARGSFISDGFYIDKEGIIKLKKVELKIKK